MPELTRRRKSGSGVSLQPALASPIAVEPTICIGLDFAWWGGGRSPASQTDTLFFASVPGDQAGWLEMRRVDLSKTFNPAAAATEPNCDADAALVIAAVEESVKGQQNTGRVVLAVDAPLRAFDRPYLPPRSRKLESKAAGGEKVAKRLEYRRCDEAARAGLRQDGCEGGWKHVWNIQPGAPLPPRVVALVAGLKRLGFDLYTRPEDAPARHLLIECFPGEALWVLGVLGHFGKYRPGEAKEYKVERWADPRLWRRPAATEKRPWPEVLGWVYRGLYGFGSREVLGVAPEVFWGWMSDLTRHVLADPLVTGKPGAPLRALRARRGKPLDDLVESMNCFLTAVSFARGHAHVWQGDDPYDGHIIGPGL
jgi:hypothetical protein